VFVPVIKHKKRFLAAPASRAEMKFLSFKWAGRLVFVLTRKAETPRYDISQFAQLRTDFPHSSPSPQRKGLHVAVAELWVFWVFALSRPWLWSCGCVGALVRSLSRAVKKACIHKPQATFMSSLQVISTFEGQSLETTSLLPFLCVCVCVCVYVRHSTGKRTQTPASRPQSSFKSRPSHLQT